MTGFVCLRADDHHDRAVPERTDDGRIQIGLAVDEGVVGHNASLKRRPESIRVRRARAEREPASQRTQHNKQ